MVPLTKAWQFPALVGTYQHWISSHSSIFDNEYGSTLRRETDGDG